MSEDSDEVERVERYLCTLRLDGVEKTIYWESCGNGFDVIAVDGDGFMLAFASTDAARSFSQPDAPPVASEGDAFYDLDAVDAWCRSNLEPRDCTALLNAWNLFGDLPNRNHLLREADQRATPLYDKLFWSCNLPAMTEPGQEYVPVWGATEGLRAQADPAARTCGVSSAAPLALLL